MNSLAGMLPGGNRNDLRRGFLRDDAGSFTVLTLFLILTMMIVAGIAVDAVRYESKRARLQNTLDRAILAAADMGQKLTPKQVVQSYFAKAGLSDYYADPTSTSGFNSKTVSATATGSMDTFFMNLLGINELTTVAQGTAEESISDIEISLVLDISGSMGRPIYEYYTKKYGSKVYKRNTGQNKLEALQDAAKEFVDTIFASTVEARTSMSIVPYASQVTVGPDLLSHYNVTSQNTINTCVDFEDADFQTTALDQSQLLYRSDVFQRSGRASPPVYDDPCDEATYARILPLADTAAKLKSKIDELQYGGNTSIEIGMKWGAALLDPSSQPVVTSMLGTGTGNISPAFSGRPFAYEDPDALKVMVVMTDGENTTEYKLGENFREQGSGVFLWMNGGSWKYSVNMREQPGNDADGDGITNEAYRIFSATSGKNRWSNSVDGGVLAHELTFYELWQLGSIDFNAYYFRRNAWYNDPWSPSGLIDGSKRDQYYNWWKYNPIVGLNGSTKNARLTDMCNAAKQAGIIVFTIGLEVPSGSAALLKSCASSPSHYYNVQGLEITTAFQSIANAIGKLRLTQ